MRINELLNASARPWPAPAAPSADEWAAVRVKPAPAQAGRRGENPHGKSAAAWARPRPDLSMSRIIRELETSQPRPAAVHAAPPAASAAIPKAASAPARRDGPPPTGPSADPSSADPSANAPSAGGRPRKGPRPRKGARPRGRLKPLADSEKRVKQRMLVKRSYYRKIDTLSELRGEVEALELEFQHVLHASPARPAAGGPTDTLRSQYAQLAVAQDALRRENEQLRAQAMDQSKMATLVRILLGEELQEQAAARAALARDHNAALPPAPRSPRLVASPLASPPSPVRASASSISVSGLTIRRMSPSDCRRLSRAAVADVRSFRDAETRADSTGASVFGWRDRRRVDADGCTLRFCLEKTFRALPARELALRMWALVSTARGLSRVYASARSTRFELLQRVDATNALFYREMRTAGDVDVGDGGPGDGGPGDGGAPVPKRVVKAFVLASLVDVSGGDGGGDRLIVLVRSVDPRSLIEARASADERETWTDVFSWGVYESAGPGGGDCRNAFGGFVATSPRPSSPPGRPGPPAPPDERQPHVLRADAAFWLLLVLVIAVRCESEVVGSPFLLPTDERT